MTDPGSELVARAAWESQRRRVLLDQQCARSEAEAEAAERAEQQRVADLEADREFVSFSKRMSGEPGISLAAVLEKSRLAGDRVERDLSQPLGSAANPALRLGDVWVDPVPQQASRSADELLGRAHQLHEDLARFRRPGRRQVARALGPDDAIDCFGCKQVGATLEQSLLLHADPDTGPLLAAEMDPPVPARTRAWSGTGWPQQTPMIYR